MKPPYEILIEITMFSGRSKGIKKLLYQQIVNRLNDVLNVNKESVLYLLMNKRLKIGELGVEFLLMKLI